MARRPRPSRPAQLATGTKYRFGAVPPPVLPVNMGGTARPWALHQVYGVCLRVVRILLCFEVMPIIQRESYDSIE
jgi:hypothetical protein